MAEVLRMPMVKRRLLVRRIWIFSEILSRN